MQRYEDAIYIENKKIERLPKGTKNGKVIKARIKTLEKKLNDLEKLREKKYYPLEHQIKKLLQMEVEEIYTPELCKRVEEQIKDTEEDIEIYRMLLEDEQKKCPTHKTFKRKIKKRTNAWIKEEVLKIINEQIANIDKNYSNSFLTKENIARKLQVKECQVEQVFMELNREGVLNQPVHHAPHDTQRDPWGFAGNMGWASDIYYIRRKEKES